MEPVGRCWYCGEDYFDTTEFEGDGFHSACARAARAIDDGLASRSQDDTMHVARARW